MSDEDNYADTIPEFCRKHRISPSTFFKLQSQGKGPRVLHVGKRSLITKESGADWRRSLEAVAQPGEAA